MLLFGVLNNGTLGARGNVARNVHWNVWANRVVRYDSRDER